MARVTAWIGVCALLVLAGCSRPPAAASTAPSFQPPLLAKQMREHMRRAWRSEFRESTTPVSVGFAQVHQESLWDPEAKSKYASGLTQFTPATARWIATILPPDVQATCAKSGGCPLDPRWALAAMARYDRLLWDSFDWAVSPTDRWAVTLAGYNGGEGWITKERAAARARGVPDTRWFAGFESVCLRAEWACKENRGYPRAILFTWMPRYAAWLGGAL